MISLRFRLFLSLIPMIIMITNIRPTHQASEYSFRSNICSKSTFNGTFGKNLNNLFSSLLSSINATTSTGFYNSSYGEIPDKVYAIGFCRGDLKPSACAACLAASTALIVKNACPDAKNGGVGSINCTLRYSNISISGIRVEAPTISGYSHGDNVSSSSRFDFNQRLTTLFETLRSKAAAGSVLKFAVGHSNAPVSSGITIYGLAQCSPDLSETDCSVCISKGLEQLPPCCYKSWSYVGASCSLRYDSDLFYDPATDPKPLPATTPLPPPSPPPATTPLPPPSPPPATTPLPPPSPPPATNTSNSGGIESGTSRMVITTLVPVVVSMFLIVSHSLSNDLVYFFVQFV